MRHAKSPMNYFGFFLRGLAVLAISFFQGATTGRAQEAAVSGVPIKIWAQGQAGAITGTTVSVSTVSSPYVGSFWSGVVTYNVCGGAYNEQGIECAVIPTFSSPYYRLQAPWRWTNGNGVEIYAYWGYVYGQYQIPTSLQLSGTFAPATPTATAAQVRNTLPATSSYQVVTVPLGNSGIVQVQPGKSYTVSSSRVNILNGAVLNISVPPQYHVVMNGVPRSSCDLADSITFTVIARNEGPSGAAGFASSVGTSRVDWRLALGTLRSGDDAGSLRLVDFSDGVTWDTLYTRSALNYEAASEEIYVHRVDNVIQQIIANQVAVNIESDPAIPTAYTISCYHPSQVAGAAPSTFQGADSRINSKNGLI